jgi:uncharacterized protein DUF4190
MTDPVAGEIEDLSFLSDTTRQVQDIYDAFRAGKLPMTDELDAALSQTRAHLLAIKLDGSKNPVAADRRIAACVQIVEMQREARPQSSLPASAPAVAPPMLKPEFEANRANVAPSPAAWPPPSPEAGASPPPSPAAGGVAPWPAPTPNAWPSPNAPYPPPATGSYPPPPPGWDPSPSQALPSEGNRIATVSLIAGIATIIIPILAIPGLVFGIVSLRRIRRRPWMAGKGRSIAGIVCSVVLLPLGLAIFIPTFISVSPTRHAPATAAPQSSGAAVYHSAFSPSDGWATGAVEANVKANLVTNGYLVTGSGRLHHLLVTPYLNRSAGLSVTTTATSFPLTNISFGAGCQTNPIGGLYVYQFIVYPNGDWYLEEAKPDHTVSALQEGTVSPLSTAATVGLSCSSGSSVAGSTQTLLVGYLNGQAEVQLAVTQNALPPGGWMPVLLMDSYGPSVSVTFTSLSVRVLPTTGGAPSPATASKGSVGSSGSYDQADVTAYCEAFPQLILSLVPPQGQTTVNQAQQFWGAVQGHFADVQSLAPPYLTLAARKGGLDLGDFVNWLDNAPQPPNAIPAGIKSELTDFDEQYSLLQGYAVANCSALSTSPPGAPQPTSAD